MKELKGNNYVACQNNPGNYFLKECVQTESWIINSS